MRVVGVAGSTRAKGNTLFLVQEALAVCAEHGLETEVINLAGKDIHDCRNCLACRKTGKCAQQDDVPELFERLVDADGIILASPVYYSSVTGLMKSFLNRVGFLSSARGRVLEHKVGGAVAVARRAGVNFTFLELVAFFLHQGMVVPGSSYWNVAYGREPGEVSGDQEGLKTVRDFAENLSWCVQKLRG